METCRLSFKFVGMESDEMHTYIGSKKTTVGYGLLLIDLENDLALPIVRIIHRYRDEALEEDKKHSCICVLF